MPEILSAIQLSKDNINFFFDFKVLFKGKHIKKLTYEW
jgi:hypothetical protein